MKRAIILAGGKGTRLLPYTTLVPKPLLPIGGEMPVLEIIIKQLVFDGFERITIAVNHLAELIQAFFGDGSKYNIKIDYSIEDKPLGTIGPLKLINDLEDHFLVMNGDVVCGINYSNILEIHQKENRNITVCTFNRKTKIDFGVIESNDYGCITSFKEKPSINHLVSMGVYILSKKSIKNIEQNTFYGFDNLILDSLKDNIPIHTFQYDGFWMDIGRPEEYDYCNSNFIEIKKLLRI